MDLNLKQCNVSTTQLYLEIVSWNTCGEIAEKALGIAAGCLNHSQCFLALERFPWADVAAKLQRSTLLSSVFVWNSLLGLYLNEITLGSMDF